MAERGDAGLGCGEGGGHFVHIGLVFFLGGARVGWSGRWVWAYRLSGGVASEVARQDSRT